jgi:pimeloyl-ACP methyl ester carboxylesterase
MGSRLVLGCALLLLLALHGGARAQTRLSVPPEPVVLLHGLARSSASMAPLQAALERAGYAVCNVDYPSRQYPIARLAREFVAPAIALCFPHAPVGIRFVTHSLGGIVVRQLAVHELAGRIGRVVMLGPPNGGSEVVDRLGSWSLFAWINGPAGHELGTDPGSTPRMLGPARFEVGVIAGNRSLNPILSWIIPGQDDGKVSVGSAELEGMTDYLVVPSTHTFMMRSPPVIAQALHFLTHGRFAHPGMTQGHSAQ